MPLRKKIKPRIVSLQSLKNFKNTCDYWLVIMDIQELIDNVKGKNGNIGIIVWLMCLWNLFWMFLFYVVVISMFHLITYSYSFIVNPGKTIALTWWYIKKEFLGIQEKDKPIAVEEQKQKQHAAIPETRENTKTHQTNNFVLPFEIKETLEYKPTVGVRGNQSTNSYIKLIRVIVLGYFKSRLENEQNFVEGRFDAPIFAFDDERVIVNSDGIGQFIHDFVWHIVSENTPIPSNHRLVYGSKYTPFLVEIADGFRPESEKSVSGIQRYVESLIDYYIAIVMGWSSADNHNTQELNKATQEAVKADGQVSKHKIEKNTKKQDEESKDDRYWKNIVVYYGLWCAVIAAFIATLRGVKPELSMSVEAVLLILGVSFLVSIYAIIVTKKKDFVSNIIFILTVPLAIVFWLEVMLGNNNAKKNQTITPNVNSVLSKSEFENVMNDLKSQDIKNMHKTKTWQNSEGKTEQLLGENPSDNDINAFLAIIANNINPNLPIMVESNVRADSVRYGSKQLIYNNTITDIPSSDHVTITDSDIQSFKVELMKEGNICVYSKHLFRYGVKLTYNYYVANGDYLMTIDILPSDCGY